MSFLALQKSFSIALSVTSGGIGSWKVGLGSIKIGSPLLLIAYPLVADGSSPIAKYFLPNKEVILTLLQLPNILNRAYEAKSLNEVAEYIYKLTSIYNKFYSENKIIVEDNIDLRESWLVLSKVVYDTNMMLLDMMGIDVPEKM